MIRNTLPFATVPEWLLYAEVSDRAVRLYAILVRHADQNGQARPSRRRLAELMGCSVDSIDRALGELKAVGALEVMHRRREDDGAQATNEYVLHPGGRPAAEGGRRTPAAPKNESYIQREVTPPERDLTTFGLALPPHAEGGAPTARSSSRGSDEVYEILFSLETGTAYSPEGRRRLPRKAAASLNAAAAEIRRTGVSPEELRAAIGAWPRVMPPGTTCTAHAVAKHLPRLLAAARGVIFAVDPLEAMAAEVDRRLQARGLA